jgi:hypothetical protein
MDNVFGLQTEHTPNPQHGIHKVYPTDKLMLPLSIVGRNERRECATSVVALLAALFRHESQGPCLLAIPAGTARRGNGHSETTPFTPLVPAYNLTSCRKNPSRNGLHN